MRYALWIAQGLLAVAFLPPGLMKLLVPLDDVALQMGFNGPLIRAIGVAEILGVLGLILPPLTRVRPGLVPLAAAGLLVVAVGATAFHLMRAEVELAAFPLVLAILAAFVAYGRWRIHPHAGRTPRSLAPAS